MSANNNDPIEVTVDKRGNVIIFIDRHNLPATEVLDMAARAMLAAGYEKSHIVQAALTYAGKHEVAKVTPETLKSAEQPSPVAAIVSSPVEPEPSKVATVESPEPLLEKTSILPIFPVPPTGSNEVVAAESKDLPAMPALDKEPKEPEIAPISAEAKPEETPPAADIIAAETEVPVAIAPAPEPAPAPEELPVLPVAAEKSEPVAAITPPEEVIPEVVAAEIQAPLEPVAEVLAPTPVDIAPEPVPSVAAEKVKSEPVAATAATPPPFEMPPLAKPPVIPLRVQAVPVSVMGNASAPTESPVSDEKPLKSKMDEILAADRKRIQALIAAAAENKTPAEAVAPKSEHAPVDTSVPPWPAPQIVEEPIVNTPEPQEAEPIKEMAAAQTDWQGQKFDPATSTSMLIPPMPGASDDGTPEHAPVADRPLAPPPLPKKPVSVVTPAMMTRPITAEVAPTPPANIPPPPRGPVSLMSRITGFVKLNTIAIPHYQSDTPESTINTPKPVTPSVLSPQPPPAKR